MATDATTSLAPSQPAKVIYPVRDGKPMAETQIHQEAMIELIHGLRDHFVDDPEVYVAGNMFLYFVEGDPRRNVSPDVMFIRGVPKTVRDTYKTWEEGGKAPDLVVEVSSKSTRREDLRTKLALYRDELKVREYFLFDPLGEYLKPRFRGFHLIDGDYQSIAVEDGQMASEVLGLDLRAVGETVRLVDPATGRIIPNRLEALDAARAAGHHRGETIHAQTAAIADREMTIRDREMTIREHEMTIRELRLAVGEHDLARVRAELEQERLMLEIARLQAGRAD